MDTANIENAYKLAQERYGELPINADILVICKSGGRSHMAASFLDANGFTSVYDMTGGMTAWQWNTEPCARMCPKPALKANGAAGPFTPTENENLSVTIELDPGSHSGADVDMWVAVHTSAGWYYYDLNKNAWGSDPPGEYEGEASMAPTVIFNGPVPPPGVYTFYFVMDLTMDGQFTMDKLYYDVLEVNIREAN